MDQALLVFLKRPTPGEVKTRLIPLLGAETAAELYRLLAEEVLRQTLPQGAEYERLLFFSPPEAGAEMEAWLPGQAWIAQVGADLGARMAAAFDEAFRRGARRVAIVGTDTPWINRRSVTESLDALAEHDLVLGPSHDGGYYLLALDRPRPELFRGIAWSTPSVFTATAERAGVLGLTVRLLDALTDIDTGADLRAAWSQLRPILERRPALVRALEPVVFG